MLMKGNNRLITDIRNILLIQIGDIGDVVLSLPSIRALRENFPQADIIVAVREKAKELIEDCPWATDVISINKTKRKWLQEIAYQTHFFSRLRKFHFDLAIDLRTGTRGAILAFLSGAKQRVGFYAHDEKPWRNRLFTNLALPEFKPGRHIAEYYFSLLETYAIEVKHKLPLYDIPEDKQKKTVDLFKKEKIPLDQPVVAIQPFSLWRYKELGIEKYIQLIKWIDSEYDVSVIVTGSSDERERAEKIITECKNTYNLAGKTSIGMLAAVLKACRLFIGGDSSGIHISAAVGTPTVSIFGPSSSDAWAPRGEQHCIVHKELACVPCHQKGCDGLEVSRCLDELTFEEIRQKITAYIEMVLGCI